MEPDSSSSSEFAAIARWCAMDSNESPDVVLGPGDDCGWLRTDGLLAVSTDSFAEGIHFHRHWGAGEAVGLRAMAAAISDLAASRARPTGCVVALSAPCFDTYTDSVMKGIQLGAKRWSCPLVGGDTTRSAEGISLHITVFGSAGSGGPLLRSGARVGDLLQLSGPLGSTARAVSRLLAGEACPWPEVRPRTDLLPHLASATAGIDISDGLLADAEHLARASQVQLVLERRSSWDLASLCGGEDYELLVTASRPLQGFEVIGQVQRRTEQPLLSFADGSPLPPRPWGFDHGSAPLA